MLRSHYQYPRRNNRLFLPHHMAACQRQESSAICQLWHVGQQIWAEHFIMTSKCRPNFEYSVVESEWGLITKFPLNFMHKLCKGAISEYLILKDNCPKTCPNSLISHFPAWLARTLLCWSSLSFSCLTDNSTVYLKSIHQGLPQQWPDHSAGGEKKSGKRQEGKGWEGTRLSSFLSLST